MSILPVDGGLTPATPTNGRCCKKCGLSKTSAEFSAYACGRLFSRCKTCLAEARRIKYAANPEAERAAQNARNAANREKVNADAARRRREKRAARGLKPRIDHAAPKSCTKCGETKPAADYYVKTKATGRRFSWCKTCHVEMGSASRQANPERHAEYMRKRRQADPEPSRAFARAYRTRNPEKVADAERRYRQSDVGKAKMAEYRALTKDVKRARDAAHRKANAGAIKAKDAAYREANREAIYARHRKWIKDNPEAFAVINARAKHRRRDRESKVQCTLTAEQWAEILRIQRNRCGRCGEKFSGTLRPHKDHVVPLSKGGGLTFANTQALCGPCNNRKYLDDTDYRGILPGFLDSLDD